MASVPVVRDYAGDFLLNGICACRSRAQGPLHSLRGKPLELSLSAFGLRAFYFTPCENILMGVRQVVFFLHHIVHFIGLFATCGSLETPHVAARAGRADPAKYWKGRASITPGVAPLLYALRQNKISISARPSRSSATGYQHARQ